MYNFTALNETQSVLDFIQFVNNDLTMGWLGIALFIGITVIMLMSFYIGTGGEIKRATATTGFLGIGIAISMRGLDLLPNFALWVIIILYAIAIAFSYEAT